MILKSNFPQIIESGGVVLTLMPEEAYVEFKVDMPLKEIESFIKKYQLQLVREEPGVLPVPSFDEAFPERRWLCLPKEVHIEQFIKQLLQNEWVRLASPVYYRADMLPKKTGFTFSDFLLVRFKPDVPDRKAAALIKELGTEDVTGESGLVGNDLCRLRILEPKRKNALEVAEQFALSPLVKDAGPDWVQLHSAISVTIPNDTLYANQWNLHNVGQSPAVGTMGEDIGAEDGWDLSQGANTVVIAILDSGCDLNHQDLVNKYVQVADRRDVVAGTNTPEDDLGHGTCCAGIAAADSNNNQGVAGIAWNCRIMPIRMMQNGFITYESRIVNAIDWARNHGAQVISMSFKWDGPHANADTAINTAHGANIVLVAASGNDGPTQPTNSIRYPANHPQVLAVGASDEFGHRCVWSATKASQFGPSLDAVAPGVNIWTTDRSGSDVGYNNALDPHVPPNGDAAGNYYSLFGGTSAATPHVAGLAGLLRSLYPTLTNDEICSIIERTAEKIGGYTYAHDSIHTSGTWNNEMGYGRINMLRALDLADVMIKDWPGDTGIEPSTPLGGNYWDFSDIVIRPIDDDVFVPSDPDQSAKVQKGQTNYLYIEVTNNGPTEARNVVVTARITAFVGLSFIYPADWTLVDATHVSPTPITATFATIPAGSTVRAKFTISSSQVDSLWGWKHNMNWSPCLLAAVNADNDYAFDGATTTGGSLVRGVNNLAQRNLSVVDATAGASVTFPFIAGNRQDDGRFMEIIVNRSRLPKAVPLLLSLEDDNKAFPLVDLSPTFMLSKNGGKIVFLERTRIKVALECIRGILTLEKGSSFDCLATEIGKVSVKGGEVIVRDDQRYVMIKENIALIRMEKQPNQLYPMSLLASIPANAKLGQKYMIQVAQRNEKEESVGGATVIYLIK